MGFHPFRILGPHLPPWLFNSIKAGYRYVEARNRKNLPFSDISALSKRLFPNSYTSDNNRNSYYSISEILKKYAGLSPTLNINAIIEHGTYGTDAIMKDDLKHMGNGIITMGKHRLRTLEAVTHKPIFFIGPYIYYAESLLTDEKIIKEKARLGTNLLVFPYHSYAEIRPLFDLASFMSYIAEIGRDYDSIRICLHWQDVVNGAASPYLGKGYECVCAGNVYDPYFLPRLKSIISCADMTASNAMGTHVGYCLGLGKGHNFFIQKVSYLNSHMHNVLENKKSYDESVLFNELLKRLSSSFSLKISDEDYDIADQIWGLSLVKPPLELRALLLGLA